MIGIPLYCYNCSDSNSSPLVQFQLLHSKFHLCFVPTRALILSTYVKFISLFPEIKPQIQQVLSSDSQSRNGSQELQQRAIEYLQLSTIATPDVLVSQLSLFLSLSLSHSLTLSLSHTHTHILSLTHTLSFSLPSLPLPLFQPAKLANNLIPKLHFTRPLCWRRCQPSQIESRLCCPSSTSQHRGQLSYTKHQGKSQGVWPQMQRVPLPQLVTLDNLLESHS